MVMIVLDASAFTKNLFFVFSSTVLLLFCMLFLEPFYVCSRKVYTVINSQTTADLSDTWFNKKRVDLD